MLYQRIQYFLKTAETGSFSRAASQMYISAQALTKQVNQLEDELGGKLFNRSSQGVTLSAFGQYAYQRFSKIHTEMTDTLHDLKLHAHDFKERINIGIFSALPREELVTPIVTHLLGRYHEHQIILNVLSLDEGGNLLRNGKIDLLISYIHEEEDWRNYQCLSLARYDAKVVVSLLHPWAVRDSITVEDMKDEIFLGMYITNPNYKVPADQMFYNTIPCSQVQLVRNFDTMFTLLQQGIGFGVFPMHFANVEMARLKAFDFPGKKLIYHAAIVYNPDNLLTGLDGIISDLQEEFSLERL